MQEMANYDSCTHHDLLHHYVVRCGDACRLVAIAIVQAQTAHTAPGKIAALWMPITTFVALGLEHRYVKLTNSSG
jgi:formate/nitrite transporter FocA (FNT family)